jgi:hypothetical protein
MQLLSPNPKKQKSRVTSNCLARSAAILGVPPPPSRSFRLKACFPFGQIFGRLRGSADEPGRRVDATPVCYPEPIADRQSFVCSRLVRRSSSLSVCCSRSVDAIAADRLVSHRAGAARRSPVHYHRRSWKPMDDIAKHAEELRRAGFEEHRIARFVELARAGKLPKAFKVLTRPICGARRRHGQGVCLAPPRYHGRCAWHGGGSALKGPRTAEGIERIRQAQLRRWARYRAQHVFDGC